MKDLIDEQEVVTVGLEPVAHAADRRRPPAPPPADHDERMRRKCDAQGLAGPRRGDMRRRTSPAARTRFCRASVSASIALGTSPPRGPYLAVFTTITDTATPSARPTPRPTVRAFTVDPRPVNRTVTWLVSGPLISNNPSTRCCGTTRSLVALDMSVSANTSNLRPRRSGSHKEELRKRNSVADPTSRQAVAGDSRPRARSGGRPAARARLRFSCEAG